MVALWNEYSELRNRLLSIMKEDTNALQWLILLHYIVMQNLVHLSPKDPHKNHTPRLAHIDVTCLLHLVFSLSTDDSPREKKFLSSSGVCVAGCKSEAWKGSCRERAFSLWLTNDEIGLLDNIYRYLISILMWGEGCPHIRGPWDLVFPCFSELFLYPLLAIIIYLLPIINFKWLVNDVILWLVAAMLKEYALWFLKQKSRILSA